MIGLPNAIAAQSLSDSLLDGRADGRYAQWPNSSANQHAVAIAVESVPAGDGMTVGSQHRLTAPKRRHQHQQRRAWQVEVSQQLIHDRKRMAWLYENIRNRIARNYRPGCGSLSTCLDCRILQCAD